MGDVVHLSGGLLPIDPVVPGPAATNQLEIVDRRYVDSHIAPHNPFHSLSRWGAVAANGHPATQVSTTVYGVNAWGYTRLYVPAGVALTGGCMCVRTAGSGAAGSGQNGYAIFEVSGTAATLVASTATDVTIWTSTGFRRKAFGSTVAAQTADREVLFGFAMSIVTTTPTLSNLNTSFWNTKISDGSTLYMGGFSGAALSSWASFTISTLTADASCPWVACY